MSSTGVMPPLIFGRKAYPKGSAKSSLQNEDHGPARALPRFAAPAVRAGTPGEAPLPAPRFFPTLRGHVAIHSRPIRRLTPQPTDRGRADCPSLKGGVTKKDFIGSAVLSTSLSPLKGEVSNQKRIFDEHPS